MPYVLSLLLSSLVLLQEVTEVFVCPIHREVQSAAPGDCSVCRRALERKRLRVVWACPMHAQFRGGPEGNCPACGMGFMPVTVEVAWVCPRHPDATFSLPGTCPRDGGPLEERERPVSHGDHNPRHGGVFFMAPDSFHHLEGTLSGEGIFRLYLYDNFTRPIDLRSFRARIGERALSVSEDARSLEVALEKALVPNPEVTVYVQFPTGREERFDFVFFGSGGESTANPEVTAKIPETSASLVSALLDCSRKLEGLIRKGAWTELYIPALEAKTLALALEERGQRDVHVPVKRLVRAAWLLDLYGDLGNRLKVEEAYGLFQRGLQEIRDAYAN